MAISDDWIEMFLLNLNIFHDYVLKMVSGIVHNSAKKFLNF